jgi:hypothetical protein
VNLRSSWLVLSALAGCGFDPVGRYSGEADVRATVSRQTTPTDAAGRSTAETTVANAREDAVAVVVTRSGNALSIELGSFCEIEVVPDAGDARRAAIDPVHEAECDVDLAGYQGPVRFRGTAVFDEHSLEVDLDGTIRAGPETGAGAIWGSYDYHVRAQRER